MKQKLQQLLPAQFGSKLVIAFVATFYTFVALQSPVTALSPGEDAVRRADGRWYVQSKAEEAVDDGQCGLPTEGEEGEEGETGSDPTGFPQSSIDAFKQAKPAIDKLTEMYKKVANEAGIPWQVLAALHYREARNNPNSSVLSGEPIGTPNPDSGVVTSSLEDSAKRAAEHIKAMAKSVYGVNLGTNPSDDDLKKAFLAYNRGSLYKSAGVGPDKSPYVMNGYDDAHVGMSWVSGVDTVSGKDGNPLGAFTIYKMLGGTGPCADGGAGGGKGSECIVKTALSQVGVRETGENCGEPAKRYISPPDGIPCGPKYPWCAYFVTWVYRKCGVPIPKMGAARGVEDWLKANAVWHARSASAPAPRPGDVITYYGEKDVGQRRHINIVISVSGNIAQTVGGNESDAVSRGSVNFRSTGDVMGWGGPKDTGGDEQPEEGAN